jgi:hypothetical protein
VVRKFQGHVDRLSWTNCIGGQPSQSTIRLVAWCRRSEALTHVR